MRLLFVEDSIDDLDLMTAELRRFGFEFEHRRVETLDALDVALETEPWSVVISDYNLPGFTAVEVLRVVRQRYPELPFILVSGTLGEERAVDIIRAGANDCVMKDRLLRLGSAIERELRDVQLREERRSLFNALRRSDDRYRRILENAPIGVAVSTPDGQLLVVNERLTQILGRTRETLIGANVGDLGLSANIIDTQRFLRDDGEILWLTVTAAPITSDDLIVEQVVWLIEDVTVQKRHEEELRSQREQLDEAQRMARVGSYEVDLVTGRRMWSSELRRLCGLDPDHTPELQRVDALLHPDDRERVLRKRADVVKTLEPYFDEYRLVLPGGIVRTMQERVRVIRDLHGTAVKLIGVVQDVTDARTQEEELQRRAVQQVVVANLGQEALSGTPVDELLTRAADAIMRLLGVDLCQMFQQVGKQFRVVGGAGCDVDRGAIISAYDASMAAHAAATVAPVVCEDLPHETRFTPSKFLLRHGIVCGIVVPISANKLEPWGVLGAHSRTHRHFDTGDIDFLRAVATVLAQAVERDRVDQQLVLHAAQQSAIAELSRIALKSVDDAVDIACNIVTDVLDVEHTVFMELDYETRTLGYRAGRCWIPAAEMTVSLAADDPIAAACVTNAPAMLDLEGFDGYAIPVASTTDDYGVLVFCTRKKRTFIEADLEFVQSLANILADAIERERARGALAVSEQRYREVVEGASEIIFAMDAEGRFTSLNAAFEHVTGRPCKEWLGRAFAPLIHPDDAPRVMDLFHSLVDRQESVALEMRLLGRDRVVVLDVTSFPKVEAGTTTALYGFARDVTERRKLEAKLEQADRLTSLGRLAATIAHEFNNVLMGISPFVEVIKRGKNVDASLEHIGRAVKRGKRITEDILRFTRPAQPVRAVFDAVTWLDAITAEARNLLPAHCRTQTNVAPGLRIDGDPHQLQQIFTNLILNARDAMGSAGGTLTIEARREAPGARLPFAIEHPERFAHFVVADTGCGIPADTLRHIFEPLFTTKKNGNGLGLAVTHQVVQRHGGEIFVESTPGTGTTFHIFLPLTEDPLAAEAQARVDASTIGAHSVLLVEDDPSVATGIASLLELAGLRVEIADSGAAAIRAVETSMPDVVVLDVGLPDIEGTSVYTAIAAKHPTLPIIFSTGHADRARLDTLIESANVGYLLKPYESSALLGAIREVMQ